MAKAGGWSITEYVTPDGKNLVLDFLKELHGRNRSEAIAVLKLLYERGSALGMPNAKPLGGGLYELRGHEVRIFYMFRPGKRITLLDGMVKKGGAIPKHTLARVKDLLEEIRAIDAEARRRT